MRKIKEPIGAANVSLKDVAIFNDDLVGAAAIIIYVSVENTLDKEWHVNPASFTLATEDGLVCTQTLLYTYEDWSNFLKTANIQKGQRVEGAIFFEIDPSASYTLTYSKYGESIQFTIPTDGTFQPMEQLLENY